MKPNPRPAERRGASPDAPSLDTYFENYFVVARNRNDSHDAVTIRREKTDRYLPLVSRDYRFGNAERGIAPHDQVYVYAATQLVWDPNHRCWALPSRWTERLPDAKPGVPNAPAAPRRSHNR
jgi:hypothetical protein